MSIYIAGTGSYLPERVLTNADLEKLVDTSDEWIRVRTGIEERHIAAADQSSGDMAKIAAERALEAAGITGADLSAIIVASTTPDHILPNTACLLQRALGCRPILCYDLSAACSGLLYSLENATALMRANKKYRYVLVCGAEKLSCIVDWSDRNTCVLFGDGAGAFVLENRDGDDHLPASCLGADGNYADTLMLPAGGSRNPASFETVEQRMHFIKMKGKETFKLAIKAMYESSNQVLAESGVSPEQVALVIPHQANRRIIQAVAQRLAVPPERVFDNVNRYGNTSAASIGIAFDDAVRSGRLKRGDLVLLTAFGSGLTWGAMLLRY
ncbi:MAG: ketoacyl-ACP synthase III [Lentisphaeria bacterium]|nr:ketoacyl-ACP synthase III [Lentisphaeria bacterium]